MKSIRPLFDVVRMQHYNEKKLFLCFVCTLLVWCLSTKRRSMAEEGNRRLARGSFFCRCHYISCYCGKMYWEMYSQNRYISIL